MPIIKKKLLGLLANTKNLLTSKLNFTTSISSFAPKFPIHTIRVHASSSCFQPFPTICMNKQLRQPIFDHEGLISYLPTWFYSRISHFLDLGFKGEKTQILAFGVKGGYHSSRVVRKEQSGLEM